MPNSPRITSILSATQLGQAITGFTTFDLGKVNVPADLQIELPHNLRLGHMVEKLVAGMLKASANYTLLYESTQLVKAQQTLGEIDFLLQEISSGKIIHLELAYKFYLYDPGLSAGELENWIGPNRNDALHQKLTKLRRKQFPLLYHPAARAAFGNIELNEAEQQLCFLVSMFVPHGFQGTLSPEFTKGIKGYYLDFDTFAQLHNPAKHYCLPPKKDWGIPPENNPYWDDFQNVTEPIKNALAAKRSVLCWQKEAAAYRQFFIVWW
jgi:hypothetical protein